MERPGSDSSVSSGTAGAALENDDKTSGARSLSMLDKIDFMVRFWRLRARHEALDTPLSGSERVELLSLLQLMASDLHLPPQGPLQFADGNIPVQLTMGGGFLAGEMRLVCPEGIVVTCKAPMMRAGQSTIVRMADAIAGVEYTLPCVVVWTFNGFNGAPSAMGLRVDGIPARTTFAMPELSVWQPAPMTALSMLGS
jgi:hypothetical protein